jgi:hypothetical protein
MFVIDGMGKFLLFEWFLLQNRAKHKGGLDFQKSINVKPWHQNAVVTVSLKNNANETIIYYFCIYYFSAMLCSR